jgi:hypothetical protein
MASCEAGAGAGISTGGGGTAAGSFGGVSAGAFGRNMNFVADFSTGGNGSGGG